MMSDRGEAKFWLEPIISLARNKGYSAHELTKIQTTIQKYEKQIKNSWQKHFKS